MQHEPFLSGCSNFFIRPSLSYTVIMAKRRLLKELNDQESCSIVGISAGPRAEGELFDWKATIFGPEDSPYQGGLFFLSLSFPCDYPFKPPRCLFDTKVYHPNIAENGYVCIWELENWSPACTVTKLLLAVYRLLGSPDPLYCLMPSIATVYKANHRQFEDTACEWTHKYAM